MKILVTYLFFLLLIAISPMGCATASHEIYTEELQLNRRPATFSGAHIALENIRFFIANVPAQAQVGAGFNAGQTISGAVSGTVVTPSIVVVPGNQQLASFTYNLAAERQLYDTLRQLSDGLISSASRSEYEIERIEVVGQYPDPKMGEAVALRSASFFLPPLANVKTELECPYQVGYILKKGDKVIRKNVLSGLVKGKYHGWYVSGVKEGNRLIADLNATAEQEIAVKLLNDIYSSIASQ